MGQWTWVRACWSTYCNYQIKITDHWHRHPLLEARVVSIQLASGVSLSQEPQWSFPAARGEERIQSTSPNKEPCSGWGWLRWRWLLGKSHIFMVNVPNSTAPAQPENREARGWVYLKTEEALPLEETQPPVSAEIWGPFIHVCLLVHCSPWCDSGI